MRILVTGAAGFIGYHLSLKLLRRGDEVIGLDNLNDYYDVYLKKDRLIQLEDYPNFTFRKLDLADRNGIEDLFSTCNFDVVINLAAQAGVRYSIKNPHAYADSNLMGFMNILEGCRHGGIKHLIFASSSSVYGANTKIPFSVHDHVDRPVSLYAATKKANELMAHAYSHLYNMPTTGLRFFTVYGPWGRPDMAIFSFTKAILEGEPINVFNYGKMQRDFTYIDDITESITRLVDKPPQPDSGRVESGSSAGNTAPYRVYNIGNNQPVELMRLIEILEDSLGVKAETNLLPLQPGEVLTTYADITELVEEINFNPETPIEVGIERFVRWYRSYYQV